MRPFHEFRIWLDRASAGGLAAAAVTAAAIVAVLSYSFVPAGSGPANGGATAVAAGGGAGVGAGTGAAAGGTGPAGGGQALQPTASGAAGGAGGSGTPGLAGTGGPGTGGSGGGTTAAPGAGGGPGGGTPNAPSGGPAGCVSPPGTDQGVSATQVKIAITIVNIVGPAGNASFGLPAPSDQQNWYQQVVDSINAAGGIACRKVVPLFVQGNPADPAGLQQQCLAIAQAGVFFEVDYGAYYNGSEPDCFPLHQIPYIGTGNIESSEQAKFFPYLFGRGMLDRIYRNAVFALQSRGFFSAAQGFKKLGIFERDCYPEINTEMLGWLHQAGVGDAQIVTYDLGCPSSGFASPSDLEQAILKFQEAGVTNVTEAQATADFANFTTVAQQQGFHPRYGIGDDGEIPTTHGTQHPDYSNIANAIAITGDRYGEEDTPGIQPSAASQRCNSIFTSKGEPSIYQQPVAFGGVACDQLWMLVNAIDHAPALQRTQVATGLQAVRTIDYSYPWGPNDFSAAHTTAGDEFWRPEQFFTSCDCWRVIDQTFHPSF